MSEGSGNSTSDMPARAPWEEIDPVLSAARLSRREFAIGAIVGGLGAISASAGIAYNAYAIAPYEPQLEHISLSLPPAHANLAGLTIGFIADTHLGPSMDEEGISKAVSLLEAESPDLILLGGDYISASPRYARPVAAILGKVARQAELTPLAVLGNHDAGEQGRDRIVTAALEAEGVRVLRNEAAVVRTDRGELWIAGVDEAIMARADPDATFSSIPRGSATLALWHEPDYAARTARLGAFAQLSGHSHGGQVRLPGLGPLFLPRGGQRYVMGMHLVEGMELYTSRGVGVFLPPVRFNCPPEVTLITLVAA
jgi:predicted MPP superfamily phosphohydrolase